MTKIYQWQRTFNSLNHVPIDPITFLVMSFLGNKIINNQNGCGPNVARAKAVWIGSGLIPTMSILRLVLLIGTRISGGRWINNSRVFVVVVVRVLCATKAKDTDDN